MYQLLGTHKAPWEALGTRRRSSREVEEEQNGGREGCGGRNRSVVDTEEEIEMVVDAH